MRARENRSGPSALKGLFGLAAAIVVLTQTLSSSAGRSKSKHHQAAPEPSEAQAMETSEVRSNAVYLFVKGIGILRLEGGALSPVMETQAPMRDLQLDSEGALWASLGGVGVVRQVAGKMVNLNPESFAKLAIRSPTDVWAINDGRGSVVHYDGDRWKTVRTRNSLTGAFQDNRLLDIVANGRSVWVSSWNGLWRVTGGRWTHLEPPVTPATGDDGEADAPLPPAYPLSMRVSQQGLVACYLSGCFVSNGSTWRASHWPATKARLHSVGAANLLAGIDADGRTIVIARLEGTDTSKSEPLPATGINDLAIDATGRVWVASGAVLTILDASGHTIKRLDLAGKVGSGAGQPVDIERVVIAGAGTNPEP
jgi:ligand-binding sensor domain-containing protein